VVGRKPTRTAAVLVALLVMLAILCVPGLARAGAAAGVSPGTECDRIPTREKVAALTFDDAWIDSDLESILATLKEAGVKATFFPTGAGVESSPDLARRIVAEGHDIGSHSYTHSKLQSMSHEEVLIQIQEAQEAFSSVGLMDPIPLFRAPWGKVGSKVLAVLGDEGYANILWTARGGDIVANRTPAQVIVAIMKELRPGAIIVLHTRNEVTPKALPELIRRIKDKGYSFVTLSEALCSPEQRVARYQQTSLESGGSIARADSEGATVTASFTGTAFELLARTGPDCGKVLVSVDGGTPQESDLYSATEQHRASVFATSSLTETRHVALISYSGTKNAASTGYSINIDAVRVTGTLKQATAEATTGATTDVTTGGTTPPLPVPAHGWDLLRFPALSRLLSVRP
jgi:peptidoglycan/xylan/chitin deacetylase (PgdA/CDA1 family)